MLPERLAKMKLWEPKTCCCCARPRTGTLILGWLGLICSLCNILGSLKYVAFSSDDFRQYCAAFNQASDPNTSNDPFASNLHTPHNDIIDPELCANYIPGAVIVHVILNLINACISGLLLWGVEKVKPKLMLPYMICTLLSIVVFSLLAVVCFILLCYNGLALVGFLILFPFAGVVFFEVYLLLVVRVCYLEINQMGLAMNGDHNIPYLEQKDLAHVENHNIDYNYKHGRSQE